MYRVLRFMKVLRVGSWKDGNVGFRYGCENVSSKYPEMGWKDHRETGWKDHRDTEKRLKERVSVCVSELCDGDVWERQREGGWYHSMVLSLRDREQQAWRRLCVRFGVNIPLSNRPMRSRGRDVDEKRRVIGLCV